MTTSKSHSVRTTQPTIKVLTRDPMQEFTSRIVAELESGAKPWIRPWDSDQASVTVGLSGVGPPPTFRITRIFAS